MSLDPAHERPSAPSSPHASSAAPQSVNGWSSDYVDELYGKWKLDQTAVDPQWRQFFMGFELGAESGATVAAVRSSAASHAASTIGAVATTPAAQRLVDRLIDAYRAKGHLAAEIDPLGSDRPFPETLTLDAFGLSDAQMEERFDPGTLPLASPATLREIVECLESTYCRSIGVEFMHVGDEARRRWLEKRVETVRNRPPLPAATRLRLLEQLIEADGFESFVEKRYIGKKRFGLEGGESLIPLLDQIVELAPVGGVGEITLAMAHRGRVNVLGHILDKSPEQILTEFEESWHEDIELGGSDVKYHQGFSCDHVTSSGHSVHLTLSANPSHLEFGNSVVLGRCRAKQRLAGDTDRSQVMPILIHGDAAFPGQGIVAECFNMMKLKGYAVGGAIHVIINNQVGFTTDPDDDWGGDYCTDLAKAWDCPIFHINCDDPEACAWAARLAVDWRQTFKTDVILDLVCYRKNGHNETDEPNFTQPLLYAKVRKQKPVLQKYKERLVEEGLITEARFNELFQALMTRLDQAQAKVKEEPVFPRIRPFRGLWSAVDPNYSPAVVESGVPLERLRSIAKALGTVPEGFHAHKTVAKLCQHRGVALDDENAHVEWAMAELLAYGSLLLDGHHIRITGQDVERGTFRHRHAVVRDQQTAEKYTPLNNIGQEQAELAIYNSPLSEASCVGFEYGYSLTDPRALVIWEAQFGDFANSAQVLFDQFIASAEVKWRRSSGLVLFLPHGYEGQGPEHSSARLERFLQLCAEDNLQVVYPSTTAQLFHMLRKQQRQRFRKPLVVLTPKSMLRLPAAMSPVSEFVQGHFQAVLADPLLVAGREGGHDPAAVTKVLFCSGKLAHELVAWREKSEQWTTAVIRIEQLYPFPDTAITKTLALHPKAEKFVWVQEEPRNMGAYRFCQAHLKELCGIDVAYDGRPDSATPACGSTKLHAMQQEKILLDAMGPMRGTHPLPSKSKSHAGH